MSTDLAKMLGMKLDDVVESAFVTSLNARLIMTEIEDRAYLRMPDAGIDFSADIKDRMARSIFLHTDGDEGYRGYPRALPEGLSFSDSRQAVRVRLGKPSDSGGGNVQRLVGRWPAWDLYDKGAYVLHIRYAEGEESIELVTLMRPDVVPK